MLPSLCEKTSQYHTCAQAWADGQEAWAEAWAPHVVGVSLQLLTFLEAVPTILSSSPSASMSSMEPWWSATTLSGALAKVVVTPQFV